jgi:hypothetical protein
MRLVELCERYFDRPVVHRGKNQASGNTVLPPRSGAGRDLGRVEAETAIRKCSRNGRGRRGREQHSPNLPLSEISGLQVQRKFHRPPCGMESSEGRVAMILAPVRVRTVWLTVGKA